MALTKYYLISYNVYANGETYLHRKKVNTNGLNTYIKLFKLGKIHEVLIENWKLGMIADNYNPITNPKDYEPNIVRENMTNEQMNELLNDITDNKLPF